MQYCSKIKGTYVSYTYLPVCYIYYTQRASRNAYAARCHNQGIPKRHPVMHMLRSVIIRYSFKSPRNTCTARCDNKIYMR